MKVMVVNFAVPGVIFDFASFSFQAPISGSAAKHSVPRKKQNARVSPRAFVFMWPSRQEFDGASIFFQVNGSRSWLRSKIFSEKFCVTGFDFAHRGVGVICSHG